MAGNNVRGWEVRRAQGEQTVEVSLLKTAKDSEQFNLFLSRSGSVGQTPLDAFAAPMITVSDAALTSGQVTIRRSPLLDLRTLERSSSVTRVEPRPSARPERRTGYRGERARDPALRGLSLRHDAF